VVAEGPAYLFSPAAHRLERNQKAILRILPFKGAITTQALSDQTVLLFTEKQVFSAVLLERHPIVSSLPVENPEGTSEPGVNTTTLAALHKKWWRTPRTPLREFFLPLPPSDYPLLRRAVDVGAYIEAISRTRVHRLDCPGEFPAYLP
jgi:hypothetical protein